MLAAQGAHQRTLFGPGGLCVHPPPGGGKGSNGDTGGGGLTGLGRRACSHGALGEPATGPWEGGGGRHLIHGARSFRRAVLLFTRETHVRCEGGSPIRASMRVGTLCECARPRC